MKSKYRLFRRGQMFWCQDNYTGRQESLRTKNRDLAERFLHARNEAHEQPLINLQIARAYLLVSDPQIGKRTWQSVMDELVKLKDGVTQVRWLVAVKSRDFDGLRHLPLLETRPDHFLRALESRKVSTNVFLRRIHNFALAMNWLPVPVIPRAQWPGFRFKEKRAITIEEHRAIVARELNPERRAFYQLAWHIGASQSDIAFLDAENIDWENKIISFARRKTGQLSQVHFGDEVEAILKTLPPNGPLFSYLRRVRAGDRSTEFKQRCRGLGISGVSLHSYRYAWAERARRCGYPERFAQEALGHNSLAVHRAYAKRAKVILPTLEVYEQHRQNDTIIPLPTVTSTTPLLGQGDQTSPLEMEAPASAQGAQEARSEGAGRVGKARPVQLTQRIVPNPQFEAFIGWNSSPGVPSTRHGAGAAPAADPERDGLTTNMASPAPCLAETDSLKMNYDEGWPWPPCSPNFEAQVSVASERR